MTPQPSIVRLQMSCSHWLTLSLIVFGFMDRQLVAGRRILDPIELQSFYKLCGHVHAFLINNHTERWQGQYVLLSKAETAVLLKVLRWYEDLMLTDNEAIRAIGEQDLTDRYEKVTAISRAIQTAQPIHSD